MDQTWHIEIKDVQAGFESNLKFKRCFWWVFGVSICLGSFQWDHKRLRGLERIRIHNSYFLWSCAWTNAETVFVYHQIEVF